MGSHKAFRSCGGRVSVVSPSKIREIRGRLLLTLPFLRSSAFICGPQNSYPVA